MTLISTAAKAGSAGAAWNIVSDVTLGAGTGTWNFAAAIPQTFTMLEVILQGTTDRAATNIADMALRINADSGANYDAASSTNNAAFSGATATAAAQLALPFWGGATSPAAFVSMVIFRIPFYASTTVAKRVAGYGFSGLADARQTSFGGEWRSTAAVTALSLLQLNGANIVAGSRATVLAF